MKKLISLFLISMFFGSMFVSCTKTPPIDSTLSLTTVKMQSTEVRTTVVSIQKYIPGSIELMPLFELELPWEELHFRYRYYAVQGFYRLVDDSELEEWSRKYDEDFEGKEPTEMALVSYIKYFNIPKEVFEDENRKLAKAWTDLGIANQDERYEIPNPDIIYTFDNDIINEYYRRE